MLARTYRPELTDFPERSLVDPSCDGLMLDLHLGCWTCIWYVAWQLIAVMLVYRMPVIPVLVHARLQDLNLQNL